MIKRPQGKGVQQYPPQDSPHFKKKTSSKAKPKRRKAY